MINSFTGKTIITEEIVQKQIAKATLADNLIPVVSKSKSNTSVHILKIKNEVSSAKSTGFPHCHETALKILWQCH